MHRPKRGEIYLIDDEEDVNNDGRPFVVISANAINGGHSVLIVPFYSQQIEERTSREYCVLFYKNEAGLSKTCVAKCDEMGLLNKTVINWSVGPIGQMDDGQLKRLMEGCKYAIGID